jgi:hypothetical protein
MKIQVNFKNKLKIIKGKSELQTKDDKLDKIFWLKLFYSVIAGIAFGFGNFTGFMSFLM